MYEYSNATAVVDLVQYPVSGNEQIDETEPAVGGLIHVDSQSQSQNQKRSIFTVAAGFELGRPGRVQVQPRRRFNHRTKRR